MMSKEQESSNAGKCEGGTDLSLARAEFTLTKPTQFATLPGGEKVDSVGGERSLSLQRFARVSRMNYYIQVLIPLVRYRR